MTAQPLLSSTILIRVMTVFLFVLTQKRVMTAFTNNVLGLMKVMCGTRVTLLSFSTREYTTQTDRWRVIGQIMQSEKSRLLCLDCLISNQPLNSGNGMDLKLGLYYDLGNPVILILIKDRPLMPGLFEFLIYSSIYYSST